MRVALTLAAAPTGALKVFASRIPGALGEEASVAGSGASYTVTLRQAATKTALPYYFTARDDSGDSPQACEWVCQGSNKPRLLQTAEYVRDALRANIPALERAVGLSVGGSAWPDGSPLKIRRLILGAPSASGSEVFPVVSVTPGGTQEQWYAAELGMEQELALSITAYAVHQNPAPWYAAIDALGEAIAAVLNQYQYLNFALPCGWLVQDAHVSAVNPVEEPAAGGYVIGSTCSWAGVLEYAYERTD
jgi:hypothetical protein